MSSEELVTVEADLNQISSTLIKLLGLKKVDGLADSIKVFSEIKYERIVMVLLDNFGLFECVYYKPKFIIGNVKAVVLLNSNDPSTRNMVATILNGGLSNAGFNLLKYLAENNLKTSFIGCSADMDFLERGLPAVITKDDTETYVEAIKLLNRTDFLWIHFLDFERLYSTYKFQPPITIAQKLITRTDKWILTFHKQLKENSVLIVVGTHGNRRVEMGYEEYYEKLRGASVPIAVFIEK
ncbi:MAG: hypothetical protein OdinLCB4_005785 [Candidatus Odinarchaeum yellowstonii]|uniref:Uncharacterized protein n=1 Tax=Odinarchaeota yellowstonii (strain LCB_4) TaxID=1841599 RepID=A0AAF0D1L9_ODILC|nr:MAG: hypothetical protein OdinLCB4_005785 [Candidatus Odinarchaeum yellowstonii]